jgi:hypothetical protein
LPRRRWPLIGAAAAGSPPRHRRAVVANQSRSGTTALASDPPQGSTGGSAGSVHVQVSSTAYTKDGLVAGAQTLIASPGPDASVGDAPSAGPLVTQAGPPPASTPSGRRRGSGEHRPRDVRGQPAAIVVVRRSDSTSVYAVQRDCGDGDAGRHPGRRPEPWAPSGRQGTTRATRRLPPMNHRRRPVCWGSRASRPQHLAVRPPFDVRTTRG